MIEKVIDKINKKLIETKVYRTVSGLAEMIQMGEISIPAVKKTDDNSRFFSAYEFKNGALFHVLDGDVDITKAESTKVGKQLQQLTYSISMYAISKYMPDPAFILLPAFNQRFNKKDYEVSSIDVAIERIDTNKDAILNKIISGIDVEKFYSKDLTLCEIDYSVKVLVNSNCIINKC